MCLWDSKPIANWAAACYTSWSLLDLSSFQSHALCAAAVRLWGHKYMNDPCLSSISTEGHTGQNGLQSSLQNALAYYNFCPLSLKKNLKTLAINISNFGASEYILVKYFAPCILTYCILS